jgi:hypothetical protein
VGTKQAAPASNHVVWQGPHFDRAATDHGVYVIQSERERGEPTWYSLWFYPKNSSVRQELGSARPEVQGRREGTRREVEALAEWHYTTKVLPRDT